MIAIVDYGVGNLNSVAKALERVGARAQVAGDPILRNFALLAGEEGSR